MKLSRYKTDIIWVVLLIAVFSVVKYKAVQRAQHVEGQCESCHNNNQFEDMQVDARFQPNN